MTLITFYLRYYKQWTFLSSSYLFTTFISQLSLDSCREVNRIYTKIDYRISIKWYTIKKFSLGIINQLHKNNLITNGSSLERNSVSLNHQLSRMRNLSLRVWNTRQSFYMVYIRSERIFLEWKKIRLGSICEIKLIDNV